MKKEVKHVDPRLTGTRPESGTGPWGLALLSGSCQALPSPSPAPLPPPSSSPSSLFLKNKNKKKLNIFFLSTKPLWTSSQRKNFWKFRKHLRGKANILRQKTGQLLTPGRTWERPKTSSQEVHARGQGPWDSRAHQFPRTTETNRPRHGKLVENVLTHIKLLLESNGRAGGGTSRTHRLGGLGSKWAARPRAPSWWPCCPFGTGCT